MPYLKFELQKFKMNVSTHLNILPLEMNHKLSSLRSLICGLDVEKLKNLFPMTL